MQHKPDSHVTASDTSGAPSRYSTAQLAKFILPTLLGVLLFLTPISIDGRLTVLIAFVIDFVNDVIKPLMVPVTVAVAVVPSVLTVLVTFTSLKHHSNRFVQLLNPGVGWTIVRMVGATLMLMTYFQWGPEWIWHRNTGGVLLYDVGPVVLAIYSLSALLLPLLTDYGLMEFIGSLLSRVFVKLFGLPGRAAIDSLASWLSASAVGIILTTQQYRQGFYTSREACVISTNFSIVSIAYLYLLLSLIGMEHVFLPWYAAVAFTGVVCAIIVPKLPPLRGKSDTYNPVVGQQLVVDQHAGEGLFAMGLRRAVDRAAAAAPPLELLKRSVHVSLDVAISVYPTMMIIGCVGLALIEFTEFFHVLSLPLVPLLELLQLPEADKAAPALLAGIVDSIMPPLLGAGIESEVTRFVLAGVAVNQIIFFTEAAIVLIRAGIGLKLRDLVVIYALRVLISLPILSLLGHLILQ
ncbi:YjiH family protein [Halomonas sp. YLB-10]|uniref:YjiH family protein n=1 Tax=Halomonas sp. YLB-10 TaxID=2483111 RepID=UPI000F5E102B|nr:nucleoside recognition domain-containing protein [Halomonas sp. YLB-10]RQW71737.1 YjiH family protein [Halomonas sp. YLB-10]